MASSAPPIETLIESSSVEVPNSSPAIREDQVKNAVAFLSHPKVKGSSVEAKRSFLERKGLTAEEIDAAFQKVPQDEPETKASPSTLVASAPVAQPTASQSQPLKPWQQGQAQALQPYNPQALSPYQVAHRPLRWSQVVLRLGFVGVSAYAVHKLLYPYITTLIANWKAAQQKRKEEEAKLFSELISAVKSMKECQSELVQTGKVLATAAGELSEQRQQQQQQQELAALRSSQSGAPVTYTSGNYQMTYTVKDPNGSGNSSSRGGLHGASNGAPPAAPPPPAAPAAASAPSQGYSSSYMEIMEMVQKNITPPNVRTDINDHPPNPSQPLSASKLPPQPKPWEAMAAARVALGSSSGSSFFSCKFDSDSSALIPSGAVSASSPKEADLAAAPSPHPPVSVLPPLGAAWKPPALPLASIRPAAAAVASPSSPPVEAADLVAVVSSEEETEISKPVSIADLARVDVDATAAVEEGVEVITEVLDV